MKWFLYAISLIWIAAGTWIILYTDECRNFYKRMYQGIDRRVLSILPTAAGILFLFAASASRHSWFIRFFGIMAVLKGVFFFFNPNDLYDDLNQWYIDSASDQTYRMHGIMALIFGTAVLSWIL